MFKFNGFNIKLKVLARPKILLSVRLHLIELIELAELILQVLIVLLRLIRDHVLGGLRLLILDVAHGQVLHVLRAQILNVQVSLNVEFFVHSLALEDRLHPEKGLLGFLGLARGNTLPTQRFVAIIRGVSQAILELLIQLHHILLYYLFSFRPREQSLLLAGLG